MTLERRCQSPLGSFVRSALGTALSCDVDADLVDCDANFVLVLRCETQMFSDVDGLYGPIDEDVAAVMDVGVSAFLPTFFGGGTGRSFLNLLHVGSSGAGPDKGNEYDDLVGDSVLGNGYPSTPSTILRDPTVDVLTDWSTDVSADIVTGVYTYVVGPGLVFTPVPGNRGRGPLLYGGTVDEIAIAQVDLVPDFDLDPPTLPSHPSEVNNTGPAYRWRATMTTDPI